LLHYMVAARSASFKCSYPYGDTDRSFKGRESGKSAVATILRAGALNRWNKKTR